MENIGEIVGRLCKEHGLSQRQLAALSGIDREYINQIINGKVKTTTLATAAKLAAGFGISPLAFFGLSAPPYQALVDLEMSVRAFVPIFDSITNSKAPIDYVACTSIKKATGSQRGYKINGLVLSPAIISGDTIIVDTDLEPTNNDYVVVIIENRAHIKRYYTNGEGNSWYEDNDGKTATSHTSLHGVITYVCRQLR